MELISIIIPVYQVKEYLQDCVDSVRMQTYTNLEIILIDDGSTDGSGEICDAYAKEDKRIIVVHQENQGLSAARNAGVNIAKGELIAFVDSDDYVAEIYLEVLYILLKKYDADIAVCEFTRYRKKMERIPNMEKINDYVMSSKQMLGEWHGRRKHIETVCWNKLYKREILLQRKEVFPLGKEHEDIYTSHLFIERAKKIAITNQILYFYRNRENSITCSRYNKKEKQKQDLLAQHVRLAYFKERKLWKSYVRLIVGHIAHKCNYIIQNICRY